MKEKAKSRNKVAVKKGKEMSTESANALDNLKVGKIKRSKANTISGKRAKVTKK